MSVPETKFAKAGDLSIAYQVVGDGDIDVVLVPQWLSNIEQYWENPDASYFLRRIASFSRLIIFDKRGTGLSDPVPDTQTLEERMDDVIAVMDAVGSERAVLLGASEGAFIATTFAATYPERCVSLVLYGACARWLESDDYPVGRSPEIAAGLRRAVDRGLGIRRLAARARAEPGRRRALPPVVGPLRAPFGPARHGAADHADDQRARRARGAVGDPGADADHAPPR